MRRWHAVVAAGALAPLLLGCTSGPAEPAATTPVAPGPETPSGSSGDPQEALAGWLTPGPHPTAEAEYALADLPLPGLREPVEVSATVVGPADAQGPVPLLVLLHGYTASCYTSDGARVTTDWPCPEDMAPFPSAEGFEYVQERLASHGFLAVSVRANGVNVQATDLRGDAGAAARSALLRRHLEAWAAGEVDVGPDLPGPDLDSVVLVGHSRGGEGVDRAVADSEDGDPWRIRGEVLLGPTGFEPPGRTQVPLVSVVGYCDGDVGAAPAQRYVDRAAAPDVPRSSILVPGANHNFFNAQWVPGESSVPGGYDDAYGEGGEVDPICDPEGSDRLSPAQQQEASARLVTLAAAAMLAGDQAAGAALDGQIPIDLGAATAWVSAVGNGRTTLRFGAGYDAAAEGGPRVEACRGVSETEDPPDCGAFQGEGTAVHWPAASRGLKAEDFARAAWTGSGGAVVLSLSEALDLADAEALEMRVVVGDGSPVRFDVAVADGAGATSPAVPVGLDAMPGGPILPSRLWGQQVTIPVAELVGVDRAEVREITLTPRSATGTVCIIDVSALPL